MADPTREEFMREIGMTPTVTAAPATNAPISIAPATEEALAKSTQQLQQSRLSVSAAGKQDAEFLLKLGARPGVPFDPELGVGFMQRIRNQFQPTEKDEIKALEAAYGPGSVRKNAYGWLIVTRPGRDGRPTDTPVDPLGADPGDLAAVIGELPALIGGGWALKGAKAVPGFFNAAVNLLRATGGAFAGRAVSDVGTRVLEGEAVEPTEIGVRRGAEAGLDVATGAIGGAVAKVGVQLFSPFSDRGSLQQIGLAARERLRQRTGVNYELTPAEMSGSGFLMNTESLEMQKPGAAVPFDEVFRRKQKQLADIQGVVLGGQVPDEELAGQRALEALGAKFAPLEQNVARAAASTAQAAEQELAQGVGTRVNKTVRGAFLRSGAELRREAYRGERDRLYGIVESDPRTQAKNIPGDELANAADQVMERQVSVQRQVPGPLLTAQGQSIPTTVEEVVPKFSEPGVLSTIEALRLGRGQEFRLDELIRMRRSIASDIAQGEALPGVQTRELNQLRDTLTRRIQDGLDAIDPALRKQWQDANDFVAREAPKFQRAGIAEIFRDPQQPNYVTDTALVERISGVGTSAQDDYRAYREFFGASSPEMVGVKQAIRDDVFGQDRIEGLIDAKGFISRITKLAKDAPDAYADAFGPAGASLRNAARALRVAKGDKIPEDELIKAMNSGNVSGQELYRMIAAQDTKARAYRNEMIKGISEGNLGPDKIKPTEVVNYMVFRKEAQPKDLVETINYIQDRPEVLEDIRRLTFKKALDDATVLHQRSGTRIINGDEMEEMLRDENTVKRLKTALGGQTFQDLIDLKDMLKLGSPVAKAAKTAGGLGAGAQYAGIVETGAFRYVSRGVKNFVMAHIYTQPKVKALVTNAALSRQAKADVVNVVAAGAPLWNDLLEFYGEATTREIAQQVNQGLTEFNAQNGGTNTAAPTADPSRDEFIRMLQQ